MLSTIPDTITLSALARLRPSPADTVVLDNTVNLVYEYFTFPGYIFVGPGNNRRFHNTGGFMPWPRRVCVSHHLRSTIKLALTLAFFLVFAAPSLDIATASAQGVQKAARTKNCQCEFDTKDYEAFGTNGACGIAMSNKARTCEISFAGTGANAQLLKSIVGEDAAQNQLAMAPVIFAQYVDYVRSGEKGLFRDPRFIERSLVVLERATVFRESAMRAKLPLEVIDKLFVEFSKKYSERIAKTFAGSAEPFTIEEGEDTFAVGEGYVELNFHKIATVRTVYFYAPPR